MLSDKPISYTPAAASRLALLEKQFRAEFETALRERKGIPGDTGIEVTASDIVEISSTMVLRFREPSSARKTGKLVLKLYGVVGLGMFVSGLYYQRLIELYSSLEKNPNQLMLVAFGLAMIVISIVLSSKYRRRENEYDDQLRLKQLSNEASRRRVREFRYRMRSREIGTHKEN